MDCGLPVSEYPPPRRRHVSVLRHVKVDSAEYAILRAGPGAVMPVIAVELNDHHHAGVGGIDSELSADRPVTFIRNPEAIKDHVPGHFEPRGPGDGRRTVGSHDSPSDPFWICITTRNRAVNRRLLLGARLRSTEHNAARQANMAGLVPTLVNVVARQRTELPLPHRRTSRLDVEGRSTMGAFAMFARSATSSRTELGRGSAARCNVEPVTARLALQRDRVGHPPRALRRAVRCLGLTAAHEHRLATPAGHDSGGRFTTACWRAVEHVAFDPGDIRRTTSERSLTFRTDTGDWHEGL